MNNKYYSPEIKDLLMLQEVEYLYEGEWLKGGVTGITVFELTIHNELLDKIAHVNYNPYDIKPIVRVKYLCQEDIEDLGFVSNRPYDGEYRSRSNIRWDCRAETLKLTHNDENNWIELRIDANYGQEYLFQGTVKNKSELKVILKQIGYESTEKS